MLYYFNGSGSFRKSIILDEYRTGVIDGETFKTFESLADDDVYGGEI
jgi:hypothetical protein